jgi:hypothetical protein
LQSNKTAPTNEGIFNLGDRAAPPLNTARRSYSRLNSNRDYRGIRQNCRLINIKPQAEINDQGRTSAAAL